MKKLFMPVILEIAVFTGIFRENSSQISTDHVIGGKMLGKAPLTQYLGFQEENMALEPSIVEIGYQTGSSYLICSDGVTDMLSDEEIREILGQKQYSRGESRGTAGNGAGQRRQR